MQKSVYKIVIYHGAIHIAVNFDICYNCRQFFLFLKMIPPCVSGNDVLKICENYYKNKSIDCSDILIKKFQIKSASNETLGFLAQHLILNVQIEQNNIEETLTFFLKILPNILDEHTEYVTSFHTFEKEISLYESFIPETNNLVSTKWAPRTFFTRKNDLIVFEHLLLSGYRMAETKSLTLDLKHLVISLKAIAAMHASSIIFQMQHPEKMATIVNESLYENSYPTPTDGNTRSSSIERGILGNLALIREIYPNKIDSLLPKCEKEIRNIFYTSLPSTKYRNVVSHSDLWSNNIMFRYDVNETTPVSAILVDFQLARWAPPAYDVLTFIYLNSNSELRDKYLQYLLETYYCYLEDELNLHKFDIQLILSRTEFFDSCKFYTVPAVINVLFFGQFIFLPADSSKDLLSDPNEFHQMIFGSRNKMILKYFREDQVYRKRMLDAVQCLVNCLK